MTDNTGDSVLAKVQRPELVEAGNVAGDVVQVVVVEGEVLQHGTARKQPQGEDGQPVVVQGEGAEGGEAGQGVLGHLRQLVVGQEKDVEVDQGTEAVRFNV